MSQWRDCIVVLMDLNGVKKRAMDGNFQASALMRSFHDLVHREMRNGLKALNHAYVWNDSVLLVAYIEDRPQAYERAIRDADNLKRKVDSTTAPSYAIAVKGRAFPPSSAARSTRVTVIEASSYAMANCFEIEAEAKKKKLRKPWYVDERIVGKVRHITGSKCIAIPLLPDGRNRKVYVYDGYLWDAV